MIKGLEDLKRLITKLNLRNAFIHSLDGKEVSGRTAVLRPFLHQGTADTTEKDSAQFEVDNKELFDQLHKNKNDIEGTLR